jgi:hypothetical protein
MLPKKWPFVSIASRMLRLGRRCVPKSYVSQPNVLRDMGVCGIERGLDGGGGSVFGLAGRFA